METFAPSIFSFIYSRAQIATAVTSVMPAFALIYYCSSRSESAKASIDMMNSPSTKSKSDPPHNP